MSQNIGDEDGGKFGRLIAKAIVIVGLLGALGTAIDGAINEWKWVEGVTSAIGHLWDNPCHPDDLECGAGT